MQRFDSEPKASFDGVDWTLYTGSELSTRRAETPRPRYDELMPELQVVEIVPVVPNKHRDVPPLPIP